mmetsp:Transcript_29027/g.79687  ORF Transcript_29027/g.79687 Transcript_29027/m.79687 type:complete len:226 (-) Transcript_29027:383-1060(-)
MSLVRISLNLSVRSVMACSTTCFINCASSKRSFNASFFSFRSCSASSAFSSLLSRFVIFVCDLLAACSSVWISACAACRAWLAAGSVTWTISLTTLFGSGAGAALDCESSTLLVFLLSARPPSTVGACTTCTAFATCSSDSNFLTCSSRPLHLVSSLSTAFASTTGAESGGGSPVFFFSRSPCFCGFSEALLSAASLGPFGFFFAGLPATSAGSSTPLSLLGLLC